MSGGIWTERPVQPAMSLRSILLYLIGVGGLAFTLTLLWLSMRVVMGVGGYCASGGPYVIATPCPDLVVALTPLSIFGIFLFGGLALWGGVSLGGSWAGILSLVWPALFLSLGWNFLDFGLHPPAGSEGDLAGSWIFCAVIFGLIGGVPLVLGLKGIQLASSSHHGYAGGRVILGTRGGTDAMRQLRDALDAHVAASGAGGTSTLTSAVAAGTPSAGESSAGESSAGDASPTVADRLERLARLHERGDLTDAEFDAAKQATIDGAAR